MTDLAAYGYSHGGGCVMLLSQLLDKANLTHYTGLDWTGYIDAVKQDTGLAETPEQDMPIKTKSHFNRYRNYAIPLKDPQGGITHVPQGSHIPVDQVDVTNDAAWKAKYPEELGHTNAGGHGIAEALPVRQQLIASLKQALPTT